MLLVLGNWTMVTTCDRLPWRASSGCRVLLYHPGEVAGISERPGDSFGFVKIGWLQVIFTFYHLNIVNHHLESFLDQLFQPPWSGQVAYHGLDHWFAYSFGTMITLWESTIPSVYHTVPVLGTSSMENKEFCWHVTRWLSSPPSITGANVLIQMAWKDRWIINETQGMPLVFVG